MSPLVSIHESAEAELEEAANFYDRVGFGLGTEFLEEVRRVIDSITHFPEASLLIRGRVRKKRL